MSTITVQRGDTLWSLAQKHLGDGMRWRDLWRINQESIEAEQRRYPEARRTMTGPNWIFPGTKLTMPDTRT